MRFQMVEELQEKKHGSLAHAPVGAWAGSPTNSRSFLGGTVWIWVDEEGREIGKSNAVPPNIYGETTRPGVLAGTPGRRILSQKEIVRVREDSEAEIRRVRAKAA